jgi:sarcosine oxidase subunit alpha
VTGRIDIGARILAPGETRPPCRTIGYVTSAAETPGAGNIALALIEGGAGRMGDTVRLFADGQSAEAEICAPVFYDAANERLRA